MKEVLSVPRSCIEIIFQNGNDFPLLLIYQNNVLICHTRQNQKSICKEFEI